MTILVTGSAGFIGANFVLDWLALHDEPVVSLDKLTYAGNRQNLASLDGDARHTFVAGDIGDSQLVARLLAEHQPRAILNFAAESHVDRSIHGPEDFIQTNIVGTFRLLEEVRAYWGALEPEAKAAFRFLHVSTDEVYGSLAPSDPAFTENNRYEPNSPYSASKAASDHLVRAYHHTFGLAVTTSNCSNNYGPYQYPEKLIPLFLLNALHGRNLPIYGDGMNVRDWLHVEDHCRGIEACLLRGVPGETYNIGGGAELPNITVIDTICAEVDRAFAEVEGLADRFPDAPAASGDATGSLKTFVTDRAGHDRRYAIDETKARRELAYAPAHAFEQGLRQTLRWYLDSETWWRPLVKA